MSKISRLFLHHNILFHLIQPFIRGNSRYRFLKHWNWQICHAHRAFQLPLRILSDKLLTFSHGEIKDNWIFSRSNPTVYSGSLWKKSLWVNSGERAAKRPLCSLFWGSWHVLHSTVHVTSLCLLWKSVEALGRMILQLQMCVSHHALVEGGKDKTEHCC